LEVSQKLMAISNEAEAGCEHDGCLVLFGIIRDCAYKIRMATEKQLKELGGEESAERQETGAGSQFGPCSC